MPIPTRSIAAAVRTLLVLLAMTTCRGDQGPRSEAPSQRTSQPSFAAAPPPGSVTLVGAGNIAPRDRTNHEATATLLDRIARTVVAPGDAGYPHGPPTNYANCYKPRRGRPKA